MEQHEQGRSLVLVPTPAERETVVTILKSDDVRICGFGPMAAAAETARLLQMLQPRSVTLVGIAGTYDPESLPIGTASAFRAVACYGMGAGQGGEFLGPKQMGIAQWQHGGRNIYDQLDLTGGQHHSAHDLLLTVCSAAASRLEVDARRALFPQAKAEDMEAFAVALACHVGQTPVSVVRGISNVAGDRDKANWQVATALESAAKLAHETLRLGGENG